MKLPDLSRVSISEGRIRESLLPPKRNLRHRAWLIREIAGEWCDTYRFGREIDDEALIRTRDILLGHHDARRGRPKK